MVDVKSFRLCQDQYKYSQSKKKIKDIRWKKSHFHHERHQLIELGWIIQRRRTFSHILTKPSIIFFELFHENDDGRYQIFMFKNQWYYLSINKILKYLSSYQIFNYIILNEQKKVIQLKFLRAQRTHHP
jgi:hypothetical protein